MINTYHGLCYTSRGALAGMRNISMAPPHERSIGRPGHNERTLYIRATSSSSRKERNVLFYEANNTLYLRLHGVTHNIKFHSGSERGNPLPQISSKCSFICIITQTGLTHATAFVSPVVEYWLKRDYGSTMKDRSDDPILS